MNICLNCGNQHDRKGKYCSDSCKQNAYRNRQTVTNTTVTQQTVTTRLMVGIKPVIKHGKDIQCFEDLPLDVQRSIITMSTDKNGLIDEEVKNRRTLIAIDYQHKFPHRYESTGI